MNIHKGGAKSLARHPNGRQSGGTKRMKRIKRSASAPIRAGTNNFLYRSGLADLVPRSCPFKRLPIPNYRVRLARRWADRFEKQTFER